MALSIDLNDIVGTYVYRSGRVDIQYQQGKSQAKGGSPDRSQLGTQGGSTEHT